MVHRLHGIDTLCVSLKGRGLGMSFATLGLSAGPTWGNRSTHWTQPIMLGVMTPVCTPEPQNIPLTGQDSPLQAIVRIKGARNMALRDIVWWWTWQC